MVHALLSWIFLVTTLHCTATTTATPHRCIPRRFGSDSFVCVCNSTYCDTVPKPATVLDADTIMVYTTSKEEHRFYLETLHFDEDLQARCGIVSIDVDPTERFQEIVGFGGSFTDAAGININSLSPDARRKLLESYFSSDGLQYNVGRVPIGGTDFSTRLYSYDDVDYDDFQLANFSLTSEDYDYKIPIIKEAQKLSDSEIKLVASAWNPPAWMKTGAGIGKVSWPKNPAGGKYYQAWAEYYIRFFKEYEKKGITYWATTSQNEPTARFIPEVIELEVETLDFTTRMLRIFVNKNLGPTLKKSPYNTTKILVYDCMRSHLLPYVSEIMRERSADQYVDGIAVHWYDDHASPPAILNVAHWLYPDKPIIQTEACIVPGYFQLSKDPVVLGSWERAELYAYYIIQNLQHWVTGWIDWNLALNLKGGPNWVKNFVDAPVIVNKVDDEFYKQPMFYAMGHFSKFVVRGSIAIDVKQSQDKLSSVAFLTPTSDVVLVVLNRATSDVSASIRCGTKLLRATIPASAIQTYIWKHAMD